MNEGQAAVRTLGHQLPDKIVLLFQFPMIPGDELLPFCRVMREPLEKRGARCNIPHPDVEPGPFPADPPGPYAVYEYPDAIMIRTVIVNALELYHSCTITILSYSWSAQSVPQTTSMLGIQGIDSW